MRGVNWGGEGYLHVCVRMKQGINHKEIKISAREMLEFSLLSLGRFALWKDLVGRVGGFLPGPFFGDDGDEHRPCLFHTLHPHSLFLARTPQDRLSCRTWQLVKMIHRWAHAVGGMGLGRAHFITKFCSLLSP